MRLRVATPLLACCSLAACGGGASAPGGNQMSNELLDPAAEIARRWGQVFTDKATIQSAATELGYKIGAMRATGATPAFGATSQPQVISIERTPLKTRTAMTMAGASADRVDSYSFTFDVTGDDGEETKAATESDKVPRRVLLGFLQRFGVAPDDEIKVALKTGTTLVKALPGATIGFAATPPADRAHRREHRSVITVTRPGVQVVAPANAPAAPNSAPRK